MSHFQDYLSQFFDWIFSFYPSTPPRLEQLKGIKLIAHRGAWNPPNILENTKEAFQKAYELGAFGIEFDVRFSSDGIPLIVHDPSLALPTGKKLNIGQSPFKKIQKEFPHIATLQEVLEKWGKKIHLMIEIKESFQKNPNHLKTLIEHLKFLSPIEDYHFLSLSTQIIEELREHFPHSSFILVSELNCHKMFKWAINQQCGGFAGHFGLITNSKKKLLQEKGLKIGTGFVSSSKLLWREQNRGIDWIFTDHLEGLVNIIKIQEKPKEL